MSFVSGDLLVVFLLRLVYNPPFLFCFPVRRGYVHGYQAEMVIDWPASRSDSPALDPAAAGLDTPVSPAATVQLGDEERDDLRDELRQADEDLAISSQKLIDLLLYEHKDPPVGKMDAGAKLRFGSPPPLTPDVSDYSYDRSALKALLESYGMPVEDFLTTSHESAEPVPEYQLTTGGIESTDPLHRLREENRKRDEAEKLRKGCEPGVVADKYGYIDEGDDVDSLPSESVLPEDVGGPLPWINPKSVIMNSMSRLDQRRWSHLFLSLYGVPAEKNDPIVRNRRKKRGPLSFNEPELGDMERDISNYYRRRAEAQARRLPENLRVAVGRWMDSVEVYYRKDLMSVVPGKRVFLSPGHAERFSRILEGLRVYRDEKLDIMARWLEGVLQEASRMYQYGPPFMVPPRLSTLDAMALPLIVPPPAGCPTGTPAERANAQAVAAEGQGTSKIRRVPAHLGLETSFTLLGLEDLEMSFEKIRTLTAEEVRKNPDFLFDRKPVRGQSQSELEEAQTAAFRGMFDWLYTVVVCSVQFKEMEKRREAAYLHLQQVSRDLDEAKAMVVKKHRDAEKIAAGEPLDVSSDIGDPYVKARRALQVLSVGGTELEVNKEYAVCHYDPEQMIEAYEMLQTDFPRFQQLLRDYNDNWKEHLLAVHAEKKAEYQRVAKEREFARAEAKRLDEERTDAQLGDLLSFFEGERVRLEKGEKACSAYWQRRNRVEKQKEEQKERHRARMEKKFEEQVIKEIAQEERKRIDKAAREERDRRETKLALKKGMSLKEWRACRIADDWSRLAFLQDETLKEMRQEFVKSADYRHLQHFGVKLPHGDQRTGFYGTFLSESVLVEASNIIPSSSDDESGLEDMSVGEGGGGDDGDDNDDDLGGDGRIPPSPVHEQQPSSEEKGMAIDDDVGQGTSTQGTSGQGTSAQGTSTQDPGPSTPADADLSKDVPVDLGPSRVAESMDHDGAEKRPRVDEPAGDSDDGAIVPPVFKRSKSGSEAEKDSEKDVDTTEVTPTPSPSGDSPMEVDIDVEKLSEDGEVSPSTSAAVGESTVTQSDLSRLKDGSEVDDADAEDNADDETDKDGSFVSRTPGDGQFSSPERPGPAPPAALSSSQVPVDLGDVSAAPKSDIADVVEKGDSEKPVPPEETTDDPRLHPSMPQFPAPSRISSSSLPEVNVYPTVPPPADADPGDDVHPPGDEVPEGQVPDDINVSADSGLPMDTSGTYGSVGTLPSVSTDAAAEAARSIAASSLLNPMSGPPYPDSPLAHAPSVHDDTSQSSFRTVFPVPSKLGQSFNIMSHSFGSGVATPPRPGATAPQADEGASPASSTPLMRPDSSSEGVTDSPAGLTKVSESVDDWDELVLGQEGEGGKEKPSPSEEGQGTSSEPTKSPEKATDRVEGVGGVQGTPVPGDPPAEAEALSEQSSDSVQRPSVGQGTSTDVMPTTPARSSLSRSGHMELQQFVMDSPHSSPLDVPSSSVGSSDASYIFRAGSPRRTRPFKPSPLVGAMRLGSPRRPPPGMAFRPPAPSDPLTMSTPAPATAVSVGVSPIRSSRGGVFEMTDTPSQYPTSSTTLARHQSGDYSPAALDLSTRPAPGDVADVAFHLCQSCTPAELDEVILYIGLLATSRVLESAPPSVPRVVAELPPSARLAICPDLASKITDYRSKVAPLSSFGDMSSAYLPAFGSPGFGLGDLSVRSSASRDRLRLDVTSSGARVMQPSSATRPVVGDVKVESGDVSSGDISASTTTNTTRNFVRRCCC